MDALVGGRSCPIALLLFGFVFVVLAHNILAPVILSHSEQKKEVEDLVMRMGGCHVLLLGGHLSCSLFWLLH